MRENKKRNSASVSARAAPDSIDGSALGTEEAAEVLGISEPAFRALAENDKAFPRPIYLSGGTRLYIESEIKAWLSQRLREGPP